MIERYIKQKVDTTSNREDFTIDPVFSSIKGKKELRIDRRSVILVAPENYSEEHAEEFRDKLNNNNFRKY